MSAPASYLVTLRPQYRKRGESGVKRLEEYYQLPIDVMTHKFLQTILDSRVDCIEFELEKCWINHDTGRVVVQVTPSPEFLDRFPVESRNTRDTIEIIKKYFNHCVYDSTISPGNDLFFFKDTVSRQTLYAYLDLFIEDIKPLPALTLPVTVSPIILPNQPSYSPTKPMTFGPITVGGIASPSRPGQPSPSKPGKPSPLVLPLPPSFGISSPVRSPQPISPIINANLVPVPIYSEMISHRSPPLEVALPVNLTEPLRTIYSDVTFGNNLLSVGPARMDAYFKRKADASVYLFVFRPINGTSFAIKFGYDGRYADQMDNIELIYDPPDPLNKGYTRQDPNQSDGLNLARIKLKAEHNPFISALLNSIELVQ